jgi:hypothetical protein
MKSKTTSTLLISEYRGKILLALPQILKIDVNVVLDILPFDENEVTLCDGQVHNVDNLISPNYYTVKLDNEQLSIPYRFYFNEPEIEKENKLSYTQKTILNCIYLRHHNGFLRQKRLEQLIDKTEFWIAPYLLQLLGEYVYEILEVLDKCINDKNIVNYKRFVKENPKYWQQTKSRMISYWNCYYRQTKSKELSWATNHR